MSHILFDLLENAGFVKADKIDTVAISRAKRKELIDVALQSAELSPASSVSNAGSIFSHTASLSLGGGLSPCANIECRRAKVKELAHFAAFYSDRVFTNNGLFTATGRIQDDDLEDAKQTFHDELELLLVLRPLIESGLVIPITPTTNKCFHCLGKSALPAEEATKFDNAFRRFTQRFSGDAQVSLEWAKSEPVVIRIEGHEDLVEHGTTYRFLGNVGKLTRKHPKLAARLKRQGHVALSKLERKKWGIDARFAHDFFDDIGFEMAVSQCLRTSVVTSRPVDIEILNDVVRSHELNRRNALIQKHMTCLVPFVGGLSAIEMLRLREAEGDAFIMFRQAFGKAVDEHIKSKAGKLTEKDAEAIYKHVIEPELARLNQKVKSAQSSILKKSRAGALGWAAAISAGFYFGFVESSLIAAARALGLTKVAADLASGLLASSGEDSIRNENMYFLWKVRHHAERA